MCPCRHGRDKLPPDKSCPICIRYADPQQRPQLDAIAARWWGEPSELFRVPPCVYQGVALEPREQGRLGLGVLRQWYPCAQGYGTVIEGQAYICACKGGCGPACGGYRAADDLKDD